jgi:hypothetical protein
MSKEEVAIVHELPGSGGTHFCRLLGSMNTIALLSEIHPLTDAWFSPKRQAMEWHGIAVSEQLSTAQTLLGCRKDRQIQRFHEVAVHVSRGNYRN